MSAQNLLEKAFISNKNEELSQAVARIIFAVIFYTYFITNILILDNELLSYAGWVFLSLVLLYSMIHYYWIIRKPQKNILRRMIAITIDISAVTLCIYFLEWASLIVYPVYLWIIVGNGMRFGSAYLYTAMVLAIIGFGLLLLYHPFWSANYKMGYGLMGIIVVLPLFFLVMLKRLQWSNQQLREELALRKRQEAIMIEQSRHAAMGEMISNIAHQWRQPLNTISLVFHNINIMHQLGTLDDKTIESSVETGTQITQMMSKTIDDFRNFFAPNKYKELFSVAQSIENAFTMIEASLKHHAIEVLMNLEKGLQCYGYPNEFSQVVLNLLVNAKDVLEEHSVKGATILISSYEQDGNAVVVVEDNGGGIQEEIIGKIFEPYFTTKEQGKGTGIGLYMSKLIIDEHMGGNLSVQNSDTGARFIITLDVMKKTGA